MNKQIIVSFKFSAGNFLKSIFIFSLLCVSVSLWLSFSATAQVRPVYDNGAIGLGQLLKRLNNTKSVMHIGAHPDDEDSGLLAYLARGENARTAYLSLTRGDGGQNIIGPELFESLGVIRTEELLQARRLDGAEQYFTRAFDYGFSKTLDEAKQKWDEKIVLCDAVRAIRSFRPLIVISRFSGTPADGHGQHQFAGYIAPLAVKAAADANRCKDAGVPWQVLKFYVSQGFRSTAEPTLRVNTGQYDALLGRSYFEIAMEGRSQHKTQEQGVLELKGERFSGLNLIESKAAKVEKETSVFDGLDISLKAVSPEASDAATRALREFDINNQQKILPFLIAGLQAIRKTGVRLKEAEFSEAIRRAAGITIDVLSDKETVAPAESIFITSRIFFPNSSNVKIKEIKLQTPNDWQTSKAVAPTDADQGFFRRETANETAYFNVEVSENAHPTEPYWLSSKRKDAMFHAGTSAIDAFQPSLINCLVTVEIDGTQINLTQPVEYRFADDIRGEVRRDLHIVPPFSINLDQNLIIVPVSEKPQTRRVVMSLTNLSEKPLDGRAKIGAGLIGGWNSVPAQQDFSLKNKGEKTAIEFNISIPSNAKPGNYDILPGVIYLGGNLNKEMHTLAYPHVQTHRFYTDARVKVSVLDLKVAPVKVGYIAGSGDAVADAIRQMNLSVEMLDENYLNGGDLAKYDVIVAGIRAFQVRPDLIANNQRVLDYVKNGGTLIVQYQRPEYEKLLPFPAKIGARVADENAAITILDASNPIFNFPNKIGDEDFKNWVQERNLYSFTTFDAQYKPLLEAHDANEPENKGGLVVAEIGKGKYIYTSYAFFRQLPAGVSGAYRIFANILSLPKSSQSQKN